MHASVPPFQGACGVGAELEVVVSPDAERPSHCPHRWLGPWPLAVPTRASPQCLTRTHAPQSGCMAVLGYRCTAFNWGAISRPQASYTGLHPTVARSKREYSLTHSLTHSNQLAGGVAVLLAKYKRRIFVSRELESKVQTSHASQSDARFSVILCRHLHGQESRGCSFRLRRL